MGSNPWTKADPEKMVNLAKVCERYGGGATRAWAPSAFRLTRATRRAKRRQRLSPNSERITLPCKVSAQNVLHMKALTVKFQ